MKKLLPILLSIVILFSLAPGLALAANNRAIVDSGTCGEMVTWTLYDDGELRISGTGSMKDYPMYSPPWYSSYRNQIISVVIDDGVTSVGTYAFSECRALTNITIPSSVTSIGSFAFEYCSALTNIEVAANNAQYASLGGVLFNKERTTLITCPPMMTGDYIIPDGVTSIGESAFRFCNSITSITIPESVSIIGAEAFLGCFKLTSITIPEGVTSIGGSAFNYCMALTNIEVAVNNAQYASLDGVLFNKEQRTLLACPEKKVGHYAVPEGIAGIEAYAFFDCSALTSVTIPEGVTSIGDYAFSGCRHLVSVNLPDGVTSIGQGAFQYCSALASITIPDSVTNIGRDAFVGCSTLTSITIPNSVTRIEEHTFLSCDSLISVTLPGSIASIESGAFYNCEALTSVYYTGTKRQWESISMRDALPETATVMILRYEISYAPGEGSGEMEAQTVEKNSAFSLPPCTFTNPSEKIFKSWRVGDAEYTPGESVLMTDDTTVTAVWQNCEHHFSVVETITVQPTCGATGSKDVTHTCDFCGHEKATTTEELPATGLHTYTRTREVVTLEPICVKAGTKEYTFTCGVCGDSYTEEEPIPATGVHDFVKLEETVITPETCKNEGLKRVTTLCTMCGERRSHDEAIPTFAHSYAPFITIIAPSGSAAGVGQKTCTGCKETVDIVLFQITYDARGSVTTMPGDVVEENTLFTLPACSLTGPEGQSFQGWELLGDLYSPGDQYPVTENIVLTPRWAYETVDIPFTTQSYPDTVTVYYDQPVRAVLPDNRIVTSYIVSDQAQTKLISNTYYMWTENTSLGNIIPGQPGMYTLQYTLSRYTETTMNIDGATQTVKRPTGEPETYTRTIIVRIPAGSFSCVAQPDGSILLRIKQNCFSGSGMVYLASYSENGRLLELKSVSITDLSQGCSTSANLKIERGGYFKAFLLDSHSAQPLAEAAGGEYT